MRIEIRALEVRLPNVNRALFHIPSLDIPAGEKLLIEGASGAGKTTFLNVIAGLVLPFNGEVRVGENIVTRMPDDEKSHLRRHHMGVIFQRLNLFSHMTVEENIYVGFPPGTENSKGRAEEALKVVGLKDRMGEFPPALSLGEQQRVAVARILASRPSLILADEPTSSLDDANAKRVAEALLAAAGKSTLIVVSHDHRLKSYFQKNLNFEGYNR